MSTGFTSFTFPSCDGVSTIWACRWEPEGTPVGVVQLAHGICEYVGRYDAFARFLTAQGFVVVGSDHLGHGETARLNGRRGIFAEKNGWTTVVDDLHRLRELVGAQYPGLPYVLMGHSMGSFLARTYLCRYPGDVSAAIISGTGQQPTAMLHAGKAAADLIAVFRGKTAVSPTVHSLALGSYNKAFAPNRTSADWISRDEAAVDTYIADEQTQWMPAVGMYSDMLGGLIALSKPSLTRKMDPATPVLFFSGAMDPVGEQTKGVLRAKAAFEQAGCTDVTVRFYPGGRHEMLNEINRDEVYADVLAWLREKLPQA